MFIYGLVIDQTNECLPDRIFSKEDAISMADKLKKKNKADYRVISMIPVYSTKEKVEQENIDW